MIDPAARARLDEWKRSLLELSLASLSSGLVDSRDDQTTIALPAVDPVRIAAALADGAAFTLEPAAPGGGEPGPGGAADDTGRLRAALATGELARRLVAIRRAARAQLADDGVHGLWLGLGVLRWCEATDVDGGWAAPADRALRAAPLALWPVELERTGDGALQLVQAAGIEPRRNDVLAERLRRDFDIVLGPEAGEAGPAGPIDVAALLGAAEAIAVTRPGWRVERSALLGIVEPGLRLAMWQDLEARGDELLASPPVVQLASRSGGALPPVVTTSLVAPLDADASQLAAVAAAGAGASFVLHGAPGTGKTQTIANLIAHCATHGKTVLFVSSKRAAREGVQHRLAALGLGELCLELPAHGAPGPVLAQLGRVLERAFRPLAGPAGDDTRLTELVSALDGHVAALHRVGPLGSSLHDVLGRLVELRTTPRAALADRDATGLDRATFERRRAAVERLAAAGVPVEPVATHPWRASTMERWPLDGRERAAAALDEAEAAAVALDAAVQGIASLIPGLVARTRGQLQALGALAGVAARSPRPGAELLTQLRPGRGDDIAERIALIRARGTGAVEAPRDPGAFLVLAHRHRALATEVNDRFTDSVGELDAHALWVQLRRWTHRVAPLRFVALRQIRAAIRGVAMPGMLETDGAMITALESVIAERAARAALLAAAEPARRWFGELGGDPLALDLERIDAAVAWAAELRLAFDAVEVARGEAGRAAAWRALVAQVAANPAAESPGGGDLAAFTRLAEAAARWQPALARLAEATGIEAATLAGTAELREQIEALRHGLDAMRDWVAFHDAHQAALAAGVGPAVAAIERGELGAGELAAAWERATLLAWADAELAAMPALARFHGAAHHAHVAAFADLERAALALVRSRALVRFAERVPRITGDAGADPGGELAALLHEIRSPGGHRPLRRLLAEIPALLPRLAPCLVMSPLAVAEHLDPALPRFDVVVFDEASQLTTAEALGALGRGDAAVVVGDARQLPPRPATRGDAADDGPVTDAARDAEPSLLDDCVAARWPELRLSWHHRSRHEDLFAFANQRYYGDALQVLPAAQRSPDLGVVWRRVDGVHDAATRCHRIEAEAVVGEVLARLRDPEQRSRSLAVIALSHAQQALIEDLLDAARLEHPDVDAGAELDARGGGSPAGEPVRVKHVEQIQGDEYDVVILSLGGGPDAAGALATSLGPLSRRGGERALNVAITRAREQLVVFSSFAPEDLAGAAAQGVQDLAALLAFARAGGGAARPAEEPPPASPITAAIARALVERGWTVRHQVGCGPFRIDLAVVDPGDPDRHVLAIEHDGAAYASARGARDRDRLRAQLLAQLGWRVHRIWSLDWWADPERETQRAHSAIITAVAAGRRRTAAAPRTRPARVATSREPARGRRGGAAPAEAASRSSPSIAGGPIAGGSIAGGSGPAEAVAWLGDASAPVARGSAPIRIARNAIAIGPYLAAAIPAGRRAPDDLFAPRHLGELGKIIDQVLAAEAPMHIDVLARRVGAYFGIGRLTRRVTDQVRVALAGRGRWGDEDNVVWRLDQDPSGVPAVRVAGQGASARRAIEEVPLAEVAAAARIVVERAAGIAANDLVRDTSRLLGFARLTDPVVARVATGVRLAAQRELIRIEAGRVLLPD